jgi:NAD(P)H-hydrate epimerase
LNRETQLLIAELVLEVKKPLLVDGDGITAISEHIKEIKKRKFETVLTPHLGELSRIIHRGIEEIKTDKVGILQRACKELNACIVMKGAHSLIGFPDERVYINMSGNAGMATAGSGDVLTGTVAAMFGQGLPIREATRKGVHLHGLAGDLAADDKGEDGITAEDILDYLPYAMKWDRGGLRDRFQDRYAVTCVR